MVELGAVARLPDELTTTKLPAVNGVVEASPPDPLEHVPACTAPFASVPKQFCEVSPARVKAPVEGIVVLPLPEMLKNVTPEPVELWTRNKSPVWAAIPWNKTVVEATSPSVTNSSAVVVWVLMSTDIVENRVFTVELFA